MAQRAAVIACVLYFFLFMAHGCVAPFMPLIWRSKGLSEHQVGILGAIRPVASFFVTPVMCAFADRHSIHQQVVYTALFLYTVTRPSVLFAGTFLAVAAVEASCSFSTSPIGSLIDSSIRHAFGGDGYGNLRLWGAIGFGIASLIGGYVCDSYGGSYTGVMIVFVANVAVAMAASTGVPIGRRGGGTPTRAKQLGDGGGDGDDVATGRDFELGEKRTESPVSPRTSSRGCAVARDKTEGEPECGGLIGTAAVTPSVSTDTAATADDSKVHLHEDDELEGNDEAQTHAALLSRPRTTSDKDGGSDNIGSGGPSRGDGEGSGAKAKEQGGVLMAVRIMMYTGESASFFMAVGLSGMGAGVIDTFLFIRLEELGGSHALCGLARLIMCIAEVPFFYLSGPLIRRVGVRGVIALTQVAYLTRFIYYSVLREPWWVLPAEVLHGLTFAAMWAATTEYAHGIAPGALCCCPHLRTTIQGVVSGIHWGLGFGLGAMLGGLLYAGLGASRCFAVSAALPSLSLLLLVLPTARRWISGTDARDGRPGAKGMPPRSRRRCWGGCCGGGGDDGRSSYELVAKEAQANSPNDRNGYCCDDDDDADGGGNSIDKTDNSSNNGSDSGEDVSSDDNDLEGQRREATAV
ncbi:unnamed protein product [Ectocarpus sp. 4 AP-2014]